MEKLSKEKTNVNNTFFKLKNSFCNADVNTLWHISSYVSKMYDTTTSEEELQLKSIMNGEIGKLVLKDGCEISFLTSSIGDDLDFVVEKYDNNSYMNIFVSTDYFGGDIVPFVYGTVQTGDWRYYIGIGDYEKGSCFVKVFYKEQPVEYPDSYFDVLLETTNNNGINECSGIVDIMERVHLLYKNIVSMNTNKKRKR